ncbi:hypothetical protein HELRODRAFT_175482 [Helobdella robusta]|uniref:Uncharacterized protein n=1 Tax=Helobdella robusta TaxID=6412 RepID=T1F9B0_HELRO|nr:hypothetical protein HELRODRAFT_175482 [Helobdella robusta]ESO00980.1 hypothetical protein HELRODRAFT_175482 [Helobdella robusta]
MATIVVLRQRLGMRIVNYSHRFIKHLFTDQTSTNLAVGICQEVDCENASISLSLSVGRGDGDVSFICFNKTMLLEAYTSDVIMFVLIDSLSMKPLEAKKFDVSSSFKSAVNIPHNAFFILTTTLMTEFVFA